MIQANELRRGNLFHRVIRHTEIHLPDTTTIFEIVAMPFEYVQAVRLGEIPAQIEKWDEIKYSDLSPIPLTEDWHNRFGVTKNGFHFFEYQIETTKKIVFSGDYVYLRDIENLSGVEGMDDNLCTLWNNDKRGRPMFVHEWQNLFYTLTGQELTIK